MHKPLCRMNLKELYEFLAAQKNDVPMKVVAHTDVPPLRILPNRLMDVPQMDSQLVREIISGRFVHLIFKN